MAGESAPDVSWMRRTRHDEAVVGGERGGVVFLGQLPEVGDAVAEGSDGAGGLGLVQGANRT